MKKIINIIISLFLFVSCGQQRSITNFTDIYVYASKEDRILVEDVVKNYLFNFTFHTPEPQKRYNPVWKLESDFIDKPKNSQLMLISIEEPKDSTIDIIADHFLGNSYNKENIILINDYFFKEQKLFILRYPNQVDMIADISKKKSWIIDELKKNDFKKLKEYSFRSGLNEDIINTLDTLFSVHIDIQKDYEIIKQNNEKKYLWIGRTYPYRWLVFYEDEDIYYKSPEDAWNRLAEKFDKILDIDIIPYQRQLEKIVIDNEEIKKLYGVYGTRLDSRNPTGGPFVSYIYDSIKSNRALIAVGFVNFPGENKVFHIKELEYIIETKK